MKNFILNYKDSEGNEKEVELRLTSNDCEKIEKANNCSLLDYVQSGTVTSIVTMLMHMRQGGGETNFTRAMTNSFYDELVDAGYTIKTILVDIIYEALAVSGVISKEDLENVKNKKEELENMTDEEKERLIEERKNLQR